MYPSSFEEYEFGYSPEFSQWEICFAWKPVKTVFGKKIWLKRCFKRTITHRYLIIKDKVYNEYATAFDLLKLGN